MSHSRVDLVDYIGKLLSSNDDVTKTHQRVVVDLQQVVTEHYHEADFDYRSDIRIMYEKRSTDEGKHKYKYVPTIVRYDGGSIKAFDDTPSTGDFVEWFNEGYRKAMTLYFPWFEKLKLRDLDVETIHALCGNNEANGDIERKHGVAIVLDTDNLYDHCFVFKYDSDHEYAPGTVMVARDSLGWCSSTMETIQEALVGRGDEFELKQSYVFKVGETNDNIIGDMAKQLMVNGAYNLLADVLYPAVNQPNSDTINIEVKLQHVVAKGIEPKSYRLSYNGHLLKRSSDPYVADVVEILDGNHVDVKCVEMLNLLPVFSGESDDLRIDHYREDVLVYMLNVKKDSTPTPHTHPEGHDDGTTAPE